MNKRKWFLEVESTRGEDAVRIAEMTEDLEHCMNSVEKAA